MIDTAKYIDILGKPWEKGARGPHTFDCYGLTKTVYSINNMCLPEYITPDEDSLIYKLIIQEKELLNRIDKPEPMSIVLFNITPLHIATVLEDSISFIHVMIKRNVVIERLDHAFWRNKIEGYYRWINE